MTIWLPELRRERPLYLEIAEAIRQDALSGRLKPGDRLPPQRELAYRLGVTTGTVTRAYAEAEKMGLLSGEVGRGSFIKTPAAAPQPFTPLRHEPEGLVDLSLATAPPVTEAAELDRTLEQVTRSAGRLDLLQYPPPEGYPLHRQMGVTWLARSGIEVDQSRVVVTGGAQPAIIATLSSITQPGDRMFVESLNYPTIKGIARHLGVSLVPLEMDDGGLVPDSLERAARNGEARLLYIVPTLQSPTSASLTLARRQAIVDIARRYNVTIIEDDLFRLLDPRLQPPTLFSLAPERTYHLTSISKTLAPGLRVGFMVGPEGREDALVRQQTVTGGRSVGLAAEVVRHWIESDAASRILSAIIAENAARRALALDVFRNRPILCTQGAPFLWLKLPDQWPPGDFARACLDRGVKITPGTAFAIDRRSDDRAARVCFSGAASRDELARALRTIDALLDEDPGERLRPVA
ncbi:MAG: PLP-dependent aminotransferase family protein [Aestuariivirga sp.]|uniref:aminotransferase-like domain-containing protein n=1 Tax=Aestuariivirga sp. TaxID=2650926 RepID=UPI0025C1063A|nr:PLP-dependent aminotransferase family protein [Aestuariivirga sp.]MCA3562429.1 PLP-dependent aminotransferase family protein [Aestuariivirga sp.]